MPLDRSGALPGRLSLFVARDRARRPVRRALFVLAGGPGQASSSLVGMLPGAPAAAVRNRYDVIGVDDRGTGRSGLLRCPEVEGLRRFRSPRAAAVCAERLGPARARYTTQETVADLEAVRAALGYERIALYGTSYGTKLAVAYARAHPDRVERLLLDSVVAPDGADPFGLASLRALPASLRRLCPRRCAGTSRDPMRDLAALFARLRERPLAGRAVTGRGRPVRRTLGAVGLADLLFDADLNPSLRAALPSAVRSALTGDPAPLLRLVRLAAPLAALPAPADFSAARFVATTCEEAPQAWPRAAPLGARAGLVAAAVAGLPSSAYAPLDRASLAAELRLCESWPEAPAAPALSTGPGPAVPALLVAGKEDLRTPASEARALAQSLPRARVVEVPGVGHSVLGADPDECADDIAGAFLAGRRSARRCRGTAPAWSWVGRLPTRLAALPAARGATGRAGRTVSAVGLTIDDTLFAWISAPGSSVGGLRGGRLGFDGRRGLRVRRLEVVPGVRITGGMAGRALTFRVSGRSAAPGRLAIARDGRVTGRLDGRPVDARLGPVRAGATAAGTTLAAPLRALAEAAARKAALRRSVRR